MNWPALQLVTENSSVCNNTNKNNLVNVCVSVNISYTEYCYVTGGLSHRRAGGIIGRYGRQSY